MWKHIEKPNGYRLSMKDTGKGWRVIVEHSLSKRCYVAEPVDYMDDYRMAAQWAHIVYNEMRGN
jgi:hypothetical protein